MRFINFTLCSLLLCVLAACSGSSSYDPRLCEQLKEKVGNNETLTEKDYDQMVGQVCAIADIAKARAEEVKGDSVKLAKQGEDTEFKKQIEYLLGFSFVLAANEDKLSPENKQKLEKMGEQMKSLKNF